MKKFAYIVAVIALIIILYTTFSSSDENRTEQPYVRPEKTTTNIGMETETVHKEANNEPYTEYDPKSPKQLIPIKSVKIETISGNTRDGFRATVVNTDSTDSDTLNYLYKWKHNGDEIYGEDANKLEWSNSFTKGDKITVEVIPYTEEGESILIYDVTMKIPNSPPKIISQPTGPSTNEEFTYQVEATDPDEDVLTYSLKDPPEGMSISDTGEIKWQYKKGKAGGKYNVIIMVEDGDGGKTEQVLHLKIEEKP